MNVVLLAAEVTMPWLLATGTMLHTSGMICAEPIADC